MALGHGDSIGSSDKGRIFNKTMYIALDYRKQMDRMNAEAANKIAQRLLEGEQDRLRYYVFLLEKREAEVFRLFYFESRFWEKTVKKIGVVLRSVYKIKDKAINHLAELYSYSTGLKGQGIFRALSGQKIFIAFSSNRYLQELFILRYD